MEEDSGDATNAKSDSESNDAGFMRRTLSAVLGGDLALPSMEELKKNPFDDDHSDDHQKSDIFKSPFDVSPLKSSKTVTSSQVAGTPAKPSNTHSEQSPAKLPIQVPPAEISPHLLYVIKANRDQVLTKFLLSFGDFFSKTRTNEILYAKLEALESGYANKGKVPRIEEVQALCDDYCIARLIAKHLPSDLPVDNPAFQVLLKQIKAPYKTCKNALADAVGGKDPKARSKALDAFKKTLINETYALFPEEEIQLQVAFRSEIEVNLKLDTVTAGLFREKSDQKTIVLKVLSSHLIELAVDLAKALPEGMIDTWKSKINVSNITGLAQAPPDAQKIANKAMTIVLDAFLSYEPPLDFLRSLKLMFQTVDRYAGANGKNIDSKLVGIAVHDFKIKLLPALVLNGCYSHFGAHLKEKTVNDGPACIWTLFIATINQGSIFQDGQKDALSKSFISKTPGCPQIIADTMREYIPKIHKYLADFVQKASK